MQSSRFQFLKNLFDEIYYCPILRTDNIPIIDRKQKGDSASISTSEESVNDEDIYKNKMEGERVNEKKKRRRKKKEIKKKANESTMRNGAEGGT